MAGLRGGQTFGESKKLFSKAFDHLQLSSLVSENSNCCIALPTLGIGRPFSLSHSHRGAGFFFFFGCIDLT